MGALRDFPKFDRAPVVVFNHFRSLLSDVEEQSRIAVEYREEYGYIPIRGYYDPLQELDYVCHEKRCFVLPNTFFIYGYGKFYSNRAARLNEKADYQFIEEYLRVIGANYVIVMTPAFEKRLKSYGFSEIGRVTKQELETASFWGESPGEDWMLLKAPFQTGLVDPPQTKVKLFPNRIEIEAKTNQEYIIKFNYGSGWHAFQDGEELDVEPYSVHTDVCYMKFKAKRDGLLVLKFRLRWLR